MTQTSTSTKNQPGIDEATRITLEKFERDQKIAQNDKEGFDVLGLACDYLELIDKKGEEGHAPKEEVKENNSNNNNTMSNIWDVFKEAAAKIAEFAEEFLRSLKKAGISDKLKKEIATICRRFKILLQNTSNSLQGYRFDVENMMETFDSIIEILIPPEDVYEDLQKMSKKETLKLFENFANENKGELKSRLETLSTQMNNNKNLKMLLADARKWSKMEKDIKDVVAKVSDEQKKFKRKMVIFGGIALAITAVVIGCVTAGIGSAAIGAAVGATVKTGTAIIVGVGVICTGAALTGLFLVGYPQVLDTLNFTKSETIEAISNGLKRIATQSDKMNTILSALYKQWRETMHYDPKASYKEVWGKVKASGLLEKLYKTRNKLNELKTAIKDTEDVCDEQLRSYTEKIYVPLLDLYN